MSVVSELAKILADQQTLLANQAAMKADLERLKSDTAAILAALDRIEKAIGVVVDLSIEFGSRSHFVKGESTMANKKATGPAIKVGCLAPKGGPIKSVGEDIVLTSPLPSSITLQALDANKNPVPLTPADSVTGTLTSDSANFVISNDGSDSLHYIGTIPPNTPMGSEANLAATEVGTIQGAAADLTASRKVIINVPPNPVAVDLAIIFG